MCRLLGADVIEFFFTPRGSIVKFECEYEREKRGDWSRIARGKNECSKFCGWKQTLLDRQSVAPRGWIFKVVEKRLEEKRLVGNTDIYFTGRESCTWRNLGKYEYFILTWLGLHLNAGWYRRLTRPGQQAHRILTNALQRKKKRVSNVLCFSLNIIFRDKKVPSGVKLRWRFTRRKSFERKIFAKILCKKGRLPSKYPFSFDVIADSFSKKETLERR